MEEACKQLKGTIQNDLLEKGNESLHEIKAIAGKLADIQDTEEGERANAIANRIIEDYDWVREELYQQSSPEPEHLRHAYDILQKAPDQLNTLNEASHAFEHIHKIHSESFEYLNDSNKNLADLALDTAKYAFKNFLDSCEQGNNWQSPKESLEEGCERLKEIVKGDLRQKWHESITYDEIPPGPISKDNKNLAIDMDANTKNRLEHNFNTHLDKEDFSQANECIEIIGGAKRLYRAHKLITDFETNFGLYLSEQYHTPIQDLNAKEFTRAIESYNRVLEGYQQGSNWSLDKKQFEDACRRLEEKPSQLKNACEKQIDNISENLNKLQEMFENFESEYPPEITNRDESTKRWIEQYKEKWNQYQEEMEIKSSFKPIEWQHKLDTYLSDLAGTYIKLEAQAYRAEGKELGNPTKKKKARNSTRMVRLMINEHKLTMYKNTFDGYFDEHSSIDNEEMKTNLHTYKEAIHTLDQQLQNLKAHREEDKFEHKLRFWRASFDNEEARFKKYLEKPALLEEVASTSHSQTKNEEIEAKISSSVSRKKFSKDIHSTKSRIDHKEISQEKDNFKYILNVIEEKLVNLSYPKQALVKGFLPEDVRDKIFDTVQHFVESGDRTNKAIDTLQAIDKDLDKWQKDIEVYQQDITYALQRLFPNEDNPSFKEVADKEFAKVENAYLQLLDSYQKRGDWSGPKKQFDEAGDQLQAFKDNLETVSSSWETIQNSRQAKIKDESASVLDKEGRDHFEQLYDNANEALQQFLNCYKQGRGNDASSHKKILQDIDEQLNPPNPYWDAELSD